MKKKELAMRRTIFIGVIFLLIILILFFVSKFVIKDFKEFFGFEFKGKEGRVERSEVDTILMAPRNEPLIIDHNAVKEFDDIPDYWIEKIKSNRMSVQYVGASHATQMPKGLILLEWVDSKFNSENGSNPTLFNEDSLRLLSGRYTGSGWSQGAGANEYWYLESGRLTTERTAIEANRIGKAINISLWGWSYHVCNPAYSTGQIGHPFNDTDLDSYLQAIERFNNNESINQTIYVYHTSVSDCSDYADSDAPWKLNRYNDLIKQTAIDNKEIVFDQADIENWNIDNTARRTFTDYLGRATYIRHTDYNEGASGVGPDTFSADHTNDALEIRKAKALWWLMARLAGWSGVARLPNTYTFNGSTTNFSAVANISEVSDAVLEKKGLGKIDFVGHTLDFANLDLDGHVVIENNKIGLNSSILQGLNVSAVLSLYNTGITGITGNVKILEDDKDCAHCSLIKNDNGNVSFSVGHFSEFSITEDLRNMTNNISQYGITWYFDKEYEYGQFVNGDYWVVTDPTTGRVNIMRITPDFTGTRNGWEVNLSNIYQQGFDSRIADFNAALVPGLSYSAASGTSVVKSISNDDTTCPDGHNTCPLDTAAVLTIISSVPANDGTTVFRPGYFGSNKVFHSTQEIHIELLKNLSPVSSSPTLDKVRNDFQRLQLDHKYQWSNRFLHPGFNMNDYGAEIAQDTGDAFLRLMLNDSIQDKMPALINYLQTGIDLYSILENGGSWPANGGHELGRKLPLVFTAMMLNNSEMKRTIAGAGYNTFQEDGQTYYSQKADNGNGQSFWGQMGSETSYWNEFIVFDSGSKNIRDPYDYIDGGTRPSLAYDFLNIKPWKAAALALNIYSELKEIWNYSYYTDLMDRRVYRGVWTENDPCAPADGVCVGGTNAGGYCNSAGEDGSSCGTSLLCNDFCPSNGYCDYNVIRGASYGVNYGPDPSNPRECIYDTNPSDGIGRLPQYNGTNKDEGYYGTVFIDNMWAKYRADFGCIFTNYVNDVPQYDCSRCVYNCDLYVAGNIYYLDAINGNDANPGTEQLPWRTWGRAQSVLQAGDTLYMTGNFGSISILGADPVGTLGNWITYKAWYGRSAPNFTYLRFDETPKNAYLKFVGIHVDPGYVTTSSGFNGVVNLKKTNFVTFEDSYFEGEKVAGEILNQIDFAPYVFNNNPLITAGVSPAESSYIMIKNSTLKYSTNTIYLAQHPSYPNIRVENWTIINNNFAEGTGDDYIKISGSGGHYIANNNFHDQNQYRALFCWTGVAIGDWSDKQWRAVTQDVTGASGIFYGTATGSCAGGSGTVFYIYADDINNLPIRSNSYTWSLDSDTNIYFTPSGNGDNAHSDFIGVEAASHDIIIEKNIFNQSEFGMQALKIESASRNIIVQNNLFYSKQASTYQLLISGTNLSIYNNVIDAGNVDPYRLRGMRLIAPVENNISFFNNIISGTVYSSGTINSDYNIWSTTPPVQFNEGPHSLINQNFNSGIFMNRAGQDYRLVVGSPAIDNGTSVPVFDDYDGNARPQGNTWDVGAYEFINEGVCVDNDSDGFNSTLGCGLIDCNDNNATIYPNAPELCDGVDNQCPGDSGYEQIDEECSPNAPSSLSTSLVDVIVNLLWQDNSDNEEQFVIERSDDGTNWIEIARVGLNVTSYSDVI